MFKMIGKLLNITMGWKIKKCSRNMESQKVILRWKFKENVPEGWKLKNCSRRIETGKVWKIE